MDRREKGGRDHWHCTPDPSELAVPGSWVPIFEGTTGGKDGQIPVE